MALQTVRDFPGIVNARKDLSPLADALQTAILGHRQKQETLRLEGIEREKQNLQTIGAQALRIRKLSEGKVKPEERMTAFQNQRRDVARLAQEAQARGEDISPFQKLLSAETPDQMNTFLSQISTRAASTIDRVNEALFTQGLGINDAAPEFRSTLGKLVGDEQLAVDLFGADSVQVKAIQEAIGAENKGEPPKLTDISGIRKEFTKQSNDFIKIRSSFNKIIGASDTGAGDVSLIFAFMKIIDPGSTVRESEFATAEQTAGIPTRIVTLYNKALAGDRLGPVQRANFKREAGNLVNAQLTIQRQLESVFRGLATRQNIDPDNVVIDFIGDIETRLGDIDTETTAVEETDLSQFTTEQLLEMRKQAQ